MEKYIYDDFSLDETNLTERDRDIIDLMINFGGVTYNDVLLNTVYFGRKYNTLKTKLQKMRKRGLIRYKQTNLFKPRYAIVFASAAEEFLFDVYGFKIRQVNPNPNTIYHLMLEQQAYFWLKKAGKDVKRTIVKRWQEGGAHKHTPDLVYPLKNGDLVYVEVENTTKRSDRYIDIFKRTKIDNPKTILYVFENDKKMKTLGKKIPVWDKIRYTTVEWLRDGVLENGKIKAIKQTEYFEKNNIKY